MKMISLSLNFGLTYKIIFNEFLYIVFFINVWKIYFSENKSSLDIERVYQIDNDLDMKYPKSLKKQNYRKLHDTILQMKKECGDLCEPDFIDIEKDIPDDKTFKRLKKSINCDNLWNDSIFDQSNDFDVPLQILPKYLRNYFTQNGRVKISPHYLVDTSKGDDQFRKWGECML